MGDHEGKPAEELKPFIPGGKKEPDTTSPSDPGKHEKKPGQK
ncbi:hypothetical protein [Streptosporangium saharense]|uniref:Uncharacterized protein n=1 Tax=Streptosporangium saharense TaxID=1706840 RepID=A0A7W7QSZ8_9ACTN|nr:hypothetical protein [Streptosporangium saharense]MBB4919250.1 hypothetical protein [Streptosporangium saharense]